MAAWLLLLSCGLGVRLVGLTNPPLDAHHVRQADTAAMARFMCRDGIDLLRPRIHWAGPRPTLVESELPLYAAITAAGWRAGGVCGGGNAWPRIQSIFWWLVGGLGLWLWVRRRLGGPTWPALVLFTLSPLALVFSRNIQPDAMGVAALLWAMFVADLEPGKGVARALARALAAALLFALGVLASGKPLFWAPLLLCLLGRRPARHRALTIIFAALVAAGIIVAWHWHARVNLGQSGASFGIWGPGARKWGGPSIWLDASTWRYIAGTLVAHTLTPLGLAGAGVGLLMTRRQRELWPWAVGLMLGLPAVIIATEGFRLHNYYQLPLIPFASVLAGQAAVAGWRRWVHKPRGAAWAAAVALLTLAGLSVWLGARFHHDSLELDVRLARVAWEAAGEVPRDQPMVALDRHPQTLLYVMDRIGWRLDDATPGAVDRLRSSGARFFLVTSSSPAWSSADLMNHLQEHGDLLASGRDWRLLKVRRGP